MSLYTTEKKPIKEIKISSNLSVGLFDDGRIMTMIRGVPFVQCRGAVIQGKSEDAIAERMREYKNMDEFLENRSEAERKLDIQVSNRHMQLVEPEEELLVHASNIQAWYDNDYNLDIIDSRIAFPILKELMKHEKKALNAFFYDAERRMAEGNQSSRMALLETIGFDNAMPVVKKWVDEKLISLLKFDIANPTAENFEQLFISINKPYESLTRFDEMIAELLIEKSRGKNEFEALDDIAFKAYTTSNDESIKDVIFRFAHGKLLYRLINGGYLKIRGLLPEQINRILLFFNGQFMPSNYLIKNNEITKFLQEHFVEMWQTGGDEEKEILMINHRVIVESFTKRGKIKYGCFRVKVRDENIERLYNNNFLKWISPEHRNLLGIIFHVHDDGVLLGMTPETLEITKPRYIHIKPFDKSISELDLQLTDREDQNTFLLGSISNGYVLPYVMDETRRTRLDDGRQALARSGRNVVKFCTSADAGVYTRELLKLVNGKIPSNFILLFFPSKTPLFFLNDITDNIRESIGMKRVNTKRLLEIKKDDRFFSTE